MAAEMAATAPVRVVRRESTAAVPFSFFCAGLEGSSIEVPLLPLVILQLLLKPFSKTSVLRTK